MNGQLRQQLTLFNPLPVTPDPQPCVARTRLQSKLQDLAIKTADEVRSWPLISSEVFNGITDVLFFSIMIFHVTVETATGK